MNLEVVMPMISSGDNAYRILLALSDGDKRFSELTPAIVKKASLARELAQLDKMRYIKRTVIDTRPPQTTYSLTKIGRDFLLSQADERLPRIEGELKRLKAIAPDKISKLKNSL